MRRIRAADKLTMVEDLLAAAEAGQTVTISPAAALALAGAIAGTVRRSDLLLEAVVRQLGGRVHVDTANLERSVGDHWTYEPDIDKGRGGLIRLTEPTPHIRMVT